MARCIVCRRIGQYGAVCSKHTDDEDVELRFRVHESAPQDKETELQCVRDVVKASHWYRRNEREDDRVFNTTPEDVEKLIAENPALFSTGYKYFRAIGMIGWPKILNPDLRKLMQATVVPVSDMFFRVEFPFNYQYHRYAMSELKNLNPVSQSGYSYTFYTTQVDEVRDATLKHWPATQFPEMEQRTREIGEVVPLGNDRFTCHVAINGGQIVGGKWITRTDGRITEFKKVFSSAVHKARISLGPFGKKHIAPATHGNLKSIIEDTDQPMEIKWQAWECMKAITDKQGLMAQSFQWRLHTKLYKEGELHRYAYTEEDDFPFGTTRTKIGEDWNQYVNAGYKMYSHQKVGCEVAWQYKRMGFWYDMRLGKTLMAMALAKRALAEGRIDRVIVVCPVTNMYDPWHTELDKQGFTIYACDNGRAEDEYAFDDDEYDAYIISYESLRNRLPLIQAAWDMQRIMVVMDETSAIKNPQAQRTKAAINLCEHPEYVYALNGTPMEQGPMDIWSQQFAVDRGATFGVSVDQFLHDYMEQGVDRRWYLTKEKQLTFELALAGSSMRYIRSEGDQFAGKDKNFRYVAVPPTEEMARSTQRIIDGYQLEDSGDAQLVKNCILVTYGHLREAAAAYDKYETVPESGIYKRRRHQLDGKCVWVRTHLKSNPGESIIIYLEFSEAEDRVKEMLYAEGIGYASTRALHGSTFTAQKRLEEINKFNRGDVRVFICKTSQARGITLNRLEAVANGMGTYPSIVYMQPTWSLGQWKQSQDRAVGTDPKTNMSIATMVYVLAVQGSIEMQIVKALRKKDNVAKTLLKDAERSGYSNPFDEMDLSTREELDEFFDAADYEARYRLNLAPPPKKLTESIIKKAAARYLAAANGIKVKEAENMPLPLEATLLINKLEGNKEDEAATRHALAVASAIEDMGASSPQCKEKLDDSSAA